MVTKPRNYEDVMRTIDVNDVILAVNKLIKPNIIKIY